MLAFDYKSIIIIIYSGFRFSVKCKFSEKVHCTEENKK